MRIGSNISAITYILTLRGAQFIMFPPVKQKQPGYGEGRATDYQNSDRKGGWGQAVLYK